MLPLLGVAGELPLELDIWRLRVVTDRLNSSEMGGDVTGVKGGDGGRGTVLGSICCGFGRGCLMEGRRGVSDGDEGT